MYWVSMKIFKKIINDQSCPFYEQKDIHFWKDLWIYTNIFKSNKFFILFKRGFFWPQLVPHSFSLNAGCSWLECWQLSYSSKTPVRPSVLSRRVTLFLTDHFYKSFPSQGSGNKETIRYYGHLNPWGSIAPNATGHITLPPLPLEAH